MENNALTNGECMIKIAVDVMGGDYAPQQIIKGSIDGAKKYNAAVILVGNNEVIQKELNKHDISGLSIEIVHTDEFLIEGEKQEIIDKKIALIEMEETIYEKLERAFPGYFGQMIFSAYQPFLNEPIRKDGEKAYCEYIKYLEIYHL